MATITELLVGLGIDSDQYERGITAAADHADSFATKIQNTLAPAITAAFAAGGAAVGAFAVTSIKAAGDFEAGMLGFQSVTGSAITDAGLTLDDFQGKFLELGAVTAFSAAEAQEAAIELAKGGVAIPSIMEDATAATLDLASAGGLELADAAGIVAKQLGVWADKGVTATDVSNLLAQAANASTVDVDELANGLANAQGTAETAGVEYDQLVTTMALLAPNFASASTAGTSLNNFLLRLQPTTDAATTAMMDLGLATADGKSKFYDANGAFIGMDQAAALLNAKLTGLSEAQKTQALSTIFGNDAMGAAVALAAAGSQGYDAMAAAMSAAGTAQDQAAIKQQGLNFAVDSLLGSFETLQIIVGLALIPILTDFVNAAIIPAVNAVSEFATMITTAGDPIFEISNAIYKFNPLLGDLVGYLLVATIEGDRFNDFFAGLPAPLQGAIRLFEGLAKIIGDNLQPILIGLAGVLGAVVVGAIASFIASVATVAAPIIAAIAIGAAMYKAYTENFLGIRDVVTTVINAVNKVITVVMSVVLAFWKQNGADILATATDAINQVLDIVSGVLNLLSIAVSAALTFIANFWTNNSALIISLVTNLWNVVKGLFQAGLDIIQGIVKLVTGLITGDFTMMKEGLLQIGTGIFNGLKTIFVSGFGLLRDAVMIGLRLVESLFSGFVDKALTIGRNIIDGIVDGVKSGVGALVNAVTDAANSALDAAMSALGISSPSKEGYWIGDMFAQGPINAIYDRMADLAQAGSDMATTLLDSAQPGDLGIGARVPVGSVGAATNGAPAGITQQFQIDAHYKTVQDEMTLRDRIRLESLLNKPSAG